MVLVLVVVVVVIVMVVVVGYWTAFVGVTVVTVVEAL